MSPFNIDWFIVVNNLVPSFWRKTKAGLEARLIPYLRSIVAPIQTLSDRLYMYQFMTMRFLDYTGQDIALENYLNDNYDNELRRIYITENNVINGSLIIDLYLQTETDPSPLSIYLQGEPGGIPFSLYLQGEPIFGAYNFTINIPAAISFDSAVVTKQIKNYSAASKTFNIITF